MNTNKLLTLGLVLLAVGCGADNGKKDGENGQRALAVVPAGTGIEGCQNIQSVCTASYPSTCYDYCADESPSCNKVQICTLSEPPTCHEVCEEPTVPTDECDSLVTAVDSEGSEFPICTDAGGGSSGGGTGTCTLVTICQQTYPEICTEICQEDLDGGGSTEPGAPGGSEPGAPGQG